MKPFTFKSKWTLIVPIVPAVLALACTLVAPPSARATYDPKHGRWLQRDPVGLKVDPEPAVIVPTRRVRQVNPRLQYSDGTNSYEYVKGRPGRATDPGGLEYWDYDTKGKEICCRFKRTVQGSLFGPYRWQRTVTGSINESDPKCACLQRVQVGTYAVGGGAAGVGGAVSASDLVVTELVSAQWGACCSCRVSVLYWEGLGFGESWHGFLQVSCSNGDKWHVHIGPNSVLGADVYVLPGEVPSSLYKEGTLKEYSACRIDCDTTSRYRSEWEKLGSGAFYFPIAGSWWWPIAAKAAVCNDESAFLDTGQ